METRLPPPPVPHTRPVARLALMSGKLAFFLLGSALLLAVGGAVMGCTADSQSASTADPAELEEAAQRAAPPFTKITDAAGLGDFMHRTGRFGKKWFPETMGAGGGFFDYNGDGWVDIVLIGGGALPGHDTAQGTQALRLYENDGDGTFTEVTRKAGLAGVRAYGFGVAAADYDNDADQDLLLTTLGRNLFFVNENGVFREAGRSIGLADEAAWSTAALFVDANRDGWLDLYVGNYVDWSPANDVYCTKDGTAKSYCTPEVYEGVPGRFYLNDGDGTFTDRTDESGFSWAPGATLGAAEFDYNDDGWSDLVVANDMQRDLLYENEGDGTFSEKGDQSGIAYGWEGNARAGMGIDVGDVSGSGEPTIFVGNFSTEMIGVYQHMGQGIFADQSSPSKVGRPSLLSLTFGLFLFDADLDRDLDLFVANGHVQKDVERVSDSISYRQPAQLFLNEGAGTFTEAAPSKEGWLSEPLLGRGAAYADVDHDGDLDVLVTENGGPAHLWRNDLKQGCFLRVHLVGRESNRDAVGARLTAVVAGERMERRVRTGSSYLSQSEKTATFGLGGASHVDTLTIRWPSGKVHRFTGVDANQRLIVNERDGTLSKRHLSPPAPPKKRQPS